MVNGAVTEPRRTRFASGAAVKLPLSEGDWVLVHAELSYGQQRRLATAGIEGVPRALAAEGEGSSLKVDWAEYDLERLTVWIMDWSFTDGDGDRVLVSRQAIEALHPDTAEEIQQALNRHIEALDAKKGAPAGQSSSGVTSSSASGSAGAGSS